MLRQLPELLPNHEVKIVKEVEINQPEPPFRGWWSLYRQDLQRYINHRPSDPLLALFLTEQGLWALFQFRVASAVYHSRLPWLVKRPLLIMCVLWQKLTEIITGISLPYGATIGPGFYVGHFGNILVHSRAIIGKNCNISQGVSIGESGRGKNRGVPMIGDRVYFATNAVVVGKLKVGSDVVIGANSLVVRDVPDYATVLGVPAQIINYHGSADYLEPQG